MILTEKARPSVAAPERAKEAVGTSRMTVASTNYDTITTSTGKSFCIADLLLVGEQNAIPLRELESITNADGRTIRRQIEAERRSGTPILSNSRTGYFLPETQQEVDMFVRQMKKRAREIRLTAAAVERGASGCTKTSRQN